MHVQCTSDLFIIIHNNCNYCSVVLSLLLFFAFYYHIIIAGVDNVDTLSTLNNLAALYSDTGKYEQSELLYKECLDHRIKQLGKRVGG